VRDRGRGAHPRRRGRHDRRSGVSRHDGVYAQPLSDPARRGRTTHISAVPVNVAVNGTVTSTAVPGVSLLRPARVAACPLTDLAALLGLAAPTAERVSVTGVTHSSEQVVPGDLYAALPGARRHGAEFVAAAAAAGAVAVLTDPAGAPAAAAAGLPALVVPNPREVLGPVAARVYGD